MTILSEAKVLFNEWIATVTDVVESVIGQYTRRPQIVLTSQAEGVLAARLKSALKGASLPDISFRIMGGQPSPALPADWQAMFRDSQVEAELAPDQVLFRSLDFPKQAADFLPGMIGSQIDRLTPWPAEEALFGWMLPSATEQDRIEVTLAATSRQVIEPLVHLATQLGSQSLTAFALPSGAAGDGTRIKLFDRILGGCGPTFDTPRILRGALLSSCAAAAVALLVSAYVGGNLDTEQQQLTRRISERRAALRLGPGSDSAMGLLAKHKQATPSSVVVLDALSDALPDGTYVTELRIDGDKVQVVGMTQDAPSLIRLIEKSPQFARATFFAPTTRAPSEAGERFHIEAHITPFFGSST